MGIITTWIYRWRMRRRRKAVIEIRMAYARANMYLGQSNASVEEMIFGDVLAYRCPEC